MSENRNCRDAAELYRDIGARIRVERRTRDLSIEALAERSGISPAFLGQVERGERKPSIATLCRIASALGVGQGILLGGLTTQRGISWEEKIAGLVRRWPQREKELLFDVLKFLFRRLLRGPARKRVP